MTVQNTVGAAYNLANINGSISESGLLFICDRGIQYASR